MRSFYDRVHDFLTNKKDMKRKIFPRDFEPYYPIGIQPCPMYVDVANRIYDRTKDMELDLPDDDRLKREIAINAAIYYEDKMSGIGLWNAFVARHQRTYHRSLPFFDDYSKLYKDDVNLQEVQLLIWIVISRNFADRFLNPVAMGTLAADSIMAALSEDDEVEVNDALYDFVYNKANTSDYFRLKPVLFWLRRSYLMHHPLSEDEFENLEEDSRKLFNRKESYYNAETLFSMSVEIGPMAAPAHSWLADMFFENGMRKEAEKLMRLSYCRQDVYEVLSYNHEYAMLLSTKGESYKVIPPSLHLFEKSKYVVTGLVKYGNRDWETNGFMIETDKEAYEKVSEHQKTLDNSYVHAYPIYMERTKGKRLAFFENILQLEDWLQTVAPEVNPNMVTRKLPAGSQVAFVSKKAGIVFAPNVVHAIKCKDNPYYKKCDARQMQSEVMNAVINVWAMHPELLNYLLDNNMIQDGDISAMSPSRDGKNLFTQNIDFIARNHRRHLYHDHDY